jgi:hypothetical protein
MFQSLYSRERDSVPIVQEAVWATRPVRTGAENIAPTGIRSPDSPAHSESLYRPRYPSPHCVRGRVEITGGPESLEKRYISCHLPRREFPPGSLVTIPTELSQLHSKGLNIIMCFPHQIFSDVTKGSVVLCRHGLDVGLRRQVGEQYWRNTARDLSWDHLAQDRYLFLCTCRKFR